MGHSEPNVAMPALRIIGNVISGTDVQTQAAVDAGALRGLVPLLNHSKKNIRREACWAVSNVAAGTLAQISALMTVPGLVASVITVLKTGEWNVRKEAAWVVSNITTTGAPAHAAQLVSAGVIDALVDSLASNDARMLCVVLDAVGSLLNVGRKLAKAGTGSGFADAFEEAGLLTHLEDLQEHAAEDVYVKCVGLIEEYYGVEDGEEGGAGADENGPANAPSASANGGFSFGLGGTSSAGLAPTQLFASPSPAGSAGIGCAPLGVFGVAPAPSAPPAAPAFAFAGGFSFA